MNNLQIRFQKAFYKARHGERWHIKERYKKGVHHYEEFKYGKHYGYLGQDINIETLLEVLGDDFWYNRGKILLDNGVDNMTGMNAFIKICDWTHNVPAHLQDEKTLETLFPLILKK